MVPIPDDPAIRTAERTGYPPRPTAEGTELKRNKSDEEERSR